tara:strand:+ start:5485 stop:5721 length:237 start_codon:yes stop_codon:yes gene_type:complete
MGGKKITNNPDYFFHPTELEGFISMPPKYLNAIKRTLSHGQENKKRPVPFDIDPYTGQLAFRFKKGGIVKKNRRCKIF